MKLPFEQLWICSKWKMWKQLFRFSYSKIFADFEAVLNTFSSNTNPSFLKSEYYWCNNYGLKCIICMSEGYQMSSDDSNSTNLTMELIHYWSYFIGVFLYWIYFLGFFYDRVRSKGIFKQMIRGQKPAVKSEYVTTI